MEFVLSFDMRTPEFGAGATELYATALDMCAWADAIGFNCVSFGEHHAAEDGYLPSPVPFAAAIAARTQRVVIRPNVLLAPLYEPVKLAEDLAVVQLLSAGRLQVVIGAGYRPTEFEMFGKRREHRKRLYLEAFQVLRRAWSGAMFEYQGRQLRVTPVPQAPPLLLLGGTHPAVARRAAHIADGYYPPAGENWAIYRQQCQQLGRPDPGASSYPLGPIYTYVTREPDAAWARLAPHIEHCVRSYADWTLEAFGVASGPFAKGVDLDDLRASGAYQVLSPEQAVAMITAMGDKATFIFNPLLAGLDPEFAWQGLRLFEREVWPHVQHMAAARVWHRLGEGSQATAGQS